MFGYQSNPVEVELFSPMQLLSLALCHIFCAQKSRSAKIEVHISKTALVLGERSREYTTRRYEKSFKFREDISAWFFNAINTNFELWINNSTVSCRNSRKSAILYNTRKKVHERKWRMKNVLHEECFAWPKCPPIHAEKNSIFFHYPIRAGFCRTRLL